MLLRCAAQHQLILRVVAGIAGAARDGLRIAARAWVFFTAVGALVEVADGAARAAQVFSLGALLVEQVAQAARELLDSLVTKAPLRDRDVEASKARAKAAGVGTRG